MQESVVLRIRRHAIFWVLALVLFLLFLWLFSGVLLPFIAGMVLAYFLDPVADRFETMGMSRVLATAIILLIFLLLFVVALMVLVPVLGDQIAGFLERLPDLVIRLQSLIASADSTWLRDLIGIDTTSLRENLNDLMKQGAGWLSALLGQIWNSGKSLVNLISLLVVTPVVAFYLLLDWDHMIERVDSWLPRSNLETIREIFRDIDTAVAGFVRGQGTVCLILGFFYGAGLTIVGLNFGLMIGLFAGLISFIPYVGSIVGFVLAICVALVQFWPEWIPVALTAFVFMVGQFLEGNILQPKLVGERVGLHPVWLMFALFAFGSLFGFTGMLIAVPASAAIGVIVKFALDRYLESELYTGKPERGSTKRKR